MTEIDEIIETRANLTKKGFLKKAEGLKDQLFQPGWDVRCSEVKETAIESIVKYAEDISQYLFNEIKCSENNLISESVKIKKQLRSYVDKTKQEVKETLVNIVSNSIIAIPEFTEKVLHLLDFTAEADEQSKRVYNEFDAKLSEHIKSAKKDKITNILEIISIILVGIGIIVEVLFHII